MNNNRLVYTPKVEIGSRQYRDDIALMKLFYDYEDYLEYLEEVEIWEDIEDTMQEAQSCLDKNRMNLMRRKVTAKCHKRSVSNSKILMHRAEKNAQERITTGYRRATILQVQCVGWEDIQFEVNGLRIVERSPKKIQNLPAKADAYEKRVSRLYGKKKQDIQKSLSATKEKDSASAAKETPADNQAETIGNSCSAYVNHKISVSHSVSSNKSSIKETKIQISLVRSPVIPIFF